MGAGEFVFGEQIAAVESPLARIALKGSNNEVQRPAISISELKMQIKS